MLVMNTTARPKEYCKLCLTKRLDKIRSHQATTERVINRLNRYRLEHSPDNSTPIVANDKICASCYTKANNTVASTSQPSETLDPTIAPQDFTSHDQPQVHQALDFPAKKPKETARKSTSQPPSSRDIDHDILMHHSSRALFPSSTYQKKHARQLSEESSASSSDKSSSDKSSKDTSFTKKITPQKKQRIELNFPRISYNTRCCAISPHKMLESKDQKVIPARAKTQLLMRRGITIPLGMKCHKHHLENGLFTEEALKSFQVASQTTAMTKHEIEIYINGLRERAKNAHLGDFQNINSVSDEDLNAYTGLDRDKFKVVMDSVKGKIYDSENRTASQAVVIYLHHIKSGLSFANIAREFNLTRLQVRRCVKTARKALYSNFVPSYLGTTANSKAFLLEEQSKLAAEVLGCEENELLIVMDGTYFYIQKSSNYTFQRLSYSGQKKRNFIKPMIVCTTSGRIIDCYGPYRAVTNDAMITKHMLEFNQEFKSFMDQSEENKVTLVLDRGFRLVNRNIF